VANQSCLHDCIFFHADSDRLVKTLASLANHKQCTEVLPILLQANFESADTGFQRRDLTYVACSCPTFHSFVPSSLSRNFETAFLFCCRVLCSSSSQLHRLQLARDACFSLVRNLGFICLLCCCLRWWCSTRQVTLMMVVVVMMMMIMMMMMMTSFYL
jgi:hypothetical protein